MQIFFKPSARREFDKLLPTVQSEIVPRLLGLERNPFPPGYRKLQGREGFRLRYRDYRILYSVNTALQTITVLAIAHRRDVYR